MAIDILLTTLTVVFALMVVFSKRTVVAAFSLLITLLCVAGVYFQLGSIFLSAVQILINAGAIAILFIFVMMLINIEELSNKFEKSKVKLLISTFTMLVALGVFTLVINNNIDYLSVSLLSDNSMKTLFQKLFDEYYVPFELATVLLLGAVVAVVIISNHPKSQGVSK
jgi:NADH-quinone oxidoreductase subunit J